MVILSMFVFKITKNEFKYYLRDFEVQTLEIDL